MQLQYDMAKHYKHIKSNSEAVNKHSHNLSGSGVDNSANVYANKKSLKLHNYSPGKQGPGFPGQDDQKVVIFSNDFNTVKYSQSPFLNKLTNLKQKLAHKTKKTPVENFIKGHKSRNSMFPKSYTEIEHYGRREPGISNKHNIFYDGMIPEESQKKSEESKISNPYSNIDVEHEIVSAYGNENKLKTNILFKDCENKIRVDSDKKRAPTDTTRSKTGIDASNDSGKCTPGAHRTSSLIPKSVNDSHTSHKRSVPMSTSKPYKSFKGKKEPSDYYQLENSKQKGNNKKDEIISILSMEINESEGLSQTYSHSEEPGCEVVLRSSKQKLEKALGIQTFENQKTLKQNIKYLQDQVNLDHPEPGMHKDNLNVVGTRPVASKYNKQRKIEYREKLEEQKKQHKKAKSHRNNKYQYIRNNHDIMTRHQRHRSSDSTDNSILKRSHGFEILYKRGEKIENLLNHYDSVEYSQEPISSQNISNHESGHDDTSSISEIENSKAVEISYQMNNDIICVDKAPSNDTKRSLESVLN